MYKKKKKTFKRGFVSYCSQNKLKFISIKKIAAIVNNKRFKREK